MPPSSDPENRFARVTPDNHAAFIWLATLLALAYSVCFLGFRIVVKRGRYTVDDFVLILGYVRVILSFVYYMGFACGHWIALFVALHYGLGMALHTTTASQREIASRAMFASHSLLILALASSKSCVLLLIRHVFTMDMKTAWASCNGYLAVISIWSLSSILALYLGCSSSSILEIDQTSRCPHEGVRWKYVLILDAVLEVGIWAMLSWLISPLRMRRRLKVLVALAFSFRLPVAGLSLVLLVFKLRYLQSRDPGLDVATSLVWQEVLLCYSLISATLPCLASFLKSFQTGGLVYITSLGRMSEMIASQKTNASQSVTLQSARSKDESKRSSSHSGTESRSD